MSVFYKFIIALIVSFTIYGCGNSSGGGNNTPLEILKVATIQDSVRTGHELTVVVKIDSDRDIAGVPIEFSVISLKEDTNESEPIELGGAGIDINNNAT